jgi:hypothetical protein
MISEMRRVAVFDMILSPDRPMDRFRQHYIIDL